MRQKRLIPFPTLCPRPIKSNLRRKKRQISQNSQNSRQKQPRKRLKHQHQPQQKLPPKHQLKPHRPHNLTLLRPVQRPVALIQVGGGHLTWPRAAKPRHKGAQVAALS
jgi:hypothetical protein